MVDTVAPIFVCLVKQQRACFLQVDNILIKLSSFKILVRFILNFTSRQIWCIPPLLFLSRKFWIGLLSPRGFNSCKTKFRSTSCQCRSCITKTTLLRKLRAFTNPLLSMGFKMDTGIWDLAGMAEYLNKQAWNKNMIKYNITSMKSRANC